MGTHYCLLQDASGERATVVSAHKTAEAAERARRRHGGGRVAESRVGQPIPGERVWYRRGAVEIAARQ